MFYRAIRRAGHLVRQLGMVRIGATFVFLLLALFVARYSWHMPLAVNAERALYDIRAVVTAPRVDQDPRIVMVVYTDETLAATAKRSPLDRVMLARALTAIDAMGAKAIAIDILIDQAQPDDQQLIDAFRSLKTPTYLAFASNRTNTTNIQLWQEQFLDGFQKQIRTSAVKSTSVLFETDSDGSLRRWPNQPRWLPPLIPNAISRAAEHTRNYDRQIAYRLPLAADRPVFASLPIDLFADPAVAPAMKSQIEGRYVLIGGDILDQDQFETPVSGFSGRSMIGLEVHAHLLAQLLDGRWSDMLPRGAIWACSIVVIIAGALSALSAAGPVLTGILMVSQLAFFTALPFALHAIGIDTLNLPAFGFGIGWGISYAAVGSAARAVGQEQRKFAQSALGKYLPRDIAAAILRDPDSLNLHGSKREIFVVFTDLEGFTELSHAIAPEMVATLLNTYLDTLSEVVLDHGGTIDKFVGDAVIAFWGAPIALPDDGERAARAAVAMFEAGERFRLDAPEGVPPIGRTRVGLHFGEAIVGNFGGEGRIQYTALGDSMNTASRLEAANKQLHSSVLVSREAADLSGLDWYRPLGRVCLRGRATPIEVMEPVPAMPLEERIAFAKLMARVNVKEADACIELTQYAKSKSDDAPLQNLMYRLAHQVEGGYYVLD